MGGGGERTIEESEIRMGGARPTQKYINRPPVHELVHEQVKTFLGVPSNNVTVNLGSLNRSISACVNN